MYGSTLLLKTTNNSLWKVYPQGFVEVSDNPGMKVLARALFSFSSID